MTTAHNIDWPAVPADRLTTCHPDVLRELLATFIHALMGAEADACAVRVNPVNEAATATVAAAASPCPLDKTLPISVSYVSRSVSLGEVLFPPQT